MKATSGWKTSSSIIAYDADWQAPARTEQYAYEELSSHNCSGSAWLYVAFPWASLIDGLVRGTALGARLDHALNCLEAPDHKRRVITVCQHIAFREHTHFFERVGITDVFASHAKIGEKRLGNFNVHPFPLYPVQAEGCDISNSQSVESFLARPLLFSFIGAYDPNCYLTPVRSWLSEIREAPGAFIAFRDEWHFEKRVYLNQVYGNELTSTDEESERDAARTFIELLEKTRFSLCPSGSGPNSIRLWECLEYGGIPVILSDQLALPGDRDVWNRACVFVEERLDAVKQVPKRLSALSNDHALIAEKLAYCAMLRARYGLRGFTTDLEAFVDRLDREQPLAADEVEFCLAAEALDQVEIIRWQAFLKAAATSVGRKCRIAFEYADSSAYGRNVGSYLEVHNWAAEHIVFISDSRSLSARLLTRFNRFFISPGGSPASVNVDLAIHGSANGSGAAEIFSPSRCWSPVCTLITPVFEGQEDIGDFFVNVAEFESYEQMEHFLVLPNSRGHELDALHGYATDHPGVVFVWLPDDPGVFEIWNTFARLGSSRYISIANIGDRQAPSQVRRLVELLDSRQECDVASAGVSVCEGSAMTWISSIGSRESYAGGSSSRKSSADLVSTQDGTSDPENFPHCIPVWRATLMVANGCFEEEHFGPWADWEYWHRAGRRGAGFAHFDEALGLFSPPAALQQGCPQAQSLKEDTPREQLDSDRRGSFDRPSTVALRAQEIISARQAGSYLEAVVNVFRLIADLQRERIGGDSTHDLLSFLARWYGIDAPLTVDVGYDWQGLPPSDEVNSAVRAVIDLIQTRDDLSAEAVRSFRDIAKDYFVRSADVKGVLMLAIIERKVGNSQGEAYFVRWAYAFDSSRLFEIVGDVYRSASSVDHLLADIGEEGASAMDSARFPRTD